MTDNLFEGGNGPVVDPSKNYLVDLVGDGKKFKSPEDLARGKYEADLFIETQNRKMDELRADYLRVMEENKAKAKLEELIDRISNPQQHQSSSDRTPAKDEGQPVFKPEQLDSLFNSKFQEYETSKKYSENANLVRSKLQEHLGTNYQETLKKQIEELGITQADFNEMARKTPQVVIKTLGLDVPAQREDFQAPPRSNKRSDNFSPTTQKRTWNWYQNLKKENPTLYHSQKITNQMHNDYQTLGRDFEDGDFNAI